VNDELETHLPPHCGLAEDGLDVEQADAAHFEQVLQQFGAAPFERGLRDAVDVDGVVGDQAVWLLENMKCVVSMHDNVAVAIALPARVVFEITETEPTMKGQTASSSYKPAILSNGARTMVPPHIGAGTRIIVDVYEQAYVGKAS
jgi:hypothetical protein